MLRALEPTDIDFLYQLENERGLWEVSETQLPFAKHLLQQYLLNATQDIYEAKQFLSATQTSLSRYCYFAKP